MKLNRLSTKERVKILRKRNDRQVSSLNRLRMNVIGTLGNRNIVEVYPKFP